MFDDVDALRAQLRDLTGTARTRPLIELGRLLADRYWRAGPGTTAGLPSLSEAIEVLSKAYGYLEPADVLRGNTAGMLGNLYASRYLAHAGSDPDREQGVALLVEALSFPTLPPALHSYSHVMLGQLYLRRAAESMQGEDLVTAMRTGQPPAASRDADRAAECFHAVADAPVRNIEITRVAQALLTAAEAMQTLMSGFGRSPGGFDLGRMMTAVEAMQRLQQQAAGGPTMPFMPSIPSVFDADNIARRHPLDRPTTVMEGPAPVDISVPRPRAAPVSVDVEGARRALDAEMARAGGAARLLRSEKPAAQVDLDELVALATTVVNGGGGGTDGLRLALVLHLRSRIDADGWGEGWDSAAGDAEAAARALAAAAGEVPDDDVELLLNLATRLGRLDLVAERLKPVAEALRTVGVGALVFPFPGELLVLEAATGRVSAEPRPDVDSGPAVLADRIVVVDDDSDDWTGSVADRVLSRVASLPQLMLLANRVPRPVITEAVFVADPRGDRDDLEWTSIETMLLRRLLYPHSIGLGRTVEYVDGTGTSAEVRDHLGASMLFLGCGITPSGVLELAGATELDLTALAGEKATDTGQSAIARPAGGLAILPPLGQGFTAFADALLAVGCVGVVGWRRLVPAPVAAAMLFLLHLRLVDDGLPAARAVHAVRLYLRDPKREPAPGLPDQHAATLAAGLAETYESDLIYRGV